MKTSSGDQVRYQRYQLDENRHRTLPLQVYSVKDDAAIRRASFRVGQTPIKSGGKPMNGCEYRPTAAAVVNQLALMPMYTWFLDEASNFREPFSSGRLLGASLAGPTPSRFRARRRRHTSKPLVVSSCPVQGAGHSRRLPLALTWPSVRRSRPSRPRKDAGHPHAWGEIFLGNLTA